MVKRLLMIALLLAIAIGISATSKRQLADGARLTQSNREAVAIFAGGCFWCMETAFEGIPGVKSVVSGYVGGTTRNPTYQQVSAGTTGHAEAVRVTYDPLRISYAKLLTIFWHNIDPLTPNAQFCDRGSQYRSGIFTLNGAQKKAALASKQALIASKRFTRPIVTEVTPAGPFYPAESYHQDFYKKKPGHYRRYRLGCGRDRRLKQLWGSVPRH